MSKAQFKIYASKLNKMKPVDVPKEKFLILESSINFVQSEFINDCLEQMKELDVEIPELAQACYIPKTRIYDLFGLRKKITKEEIEIIKKKLSML